jgi:hypothetical protein
MFTFAAAAYNLSTNAKPTGPACLKDPQELSGWPYERPPGRPTSPLWARQPRITASKPLTQNFQGALFSSLLVIQPRLFWRTSIFRNQSTTSSCSTCRARPRVVPGLVTELAGALLDGDQAFAVDP